MYSRVESGDYNVAYIYLNGNMLVSSGHDTYTDSGAVISTSGRELTMEVSQGDNIKLRTTHMGDEYYYINFCAQYVPKM